jgi:phospholipid transport system substrate-binding protein
MEVLTMPAHTSKTSKITKTLTFFVGLLTAMMVALPAFAGPPTDFVRLKSDSLFDVINDPVSPKRTAALKKEVRTLVAYDELAKRSLGKHWEARSEAERKKFIGLLEELVELNYANRFNQRQKNLRYMVSYTDEKVRAKTGQAIVKTEVKYGDELVLLDYKLVNQDKKDYVIYDVVFDDISLEETYREAYVPIIDKEGWGSLIARMEAKLKELRKK